MLDKITNGVAAATTIGMSLIGLAIILQVVFGVGVPFLGGDVIGTIISIVAQLGDAGLVRPWASVLLSDGAPSIVPAPEGLAQNWISIHDAMAGILIQGLETLPRQLLIASGLTMGYTNIRQQNNWLVHDLVKL